MPEAYVITGIPGAGKTTVSRLLAERFERSALIEADAVQGMLVRGLLWPDDEPYEEAMGQLRLRAEQCARLAAGFVGAGFTTVVDDVLIVRERLEIYEAALPDLRLVVLAPPAEVTVARDAARPDKTVGDRWVHLDAQQRGHLGARGLWIDSGDLTPAETVERIAKAWAPAA